MCSISYVSETHEGPCNEGTAVIPPRCRPHPIWAWHRHLPPSSWKHTQEKMSVVACESGFSMFILVCVCVCGADLGVRISLYCSFSTLVVAATDMGMTMLLMSKELSPLLLRMGVCTEYTPHIHTHTPTHSAPLSTYNT